MIFAQRGNGTGRQFAATTVRNANATVNNNFGLL